jgi:hypothetical protein
MRSQFDIDTAALAGRQYGVVHRRQLLALGLSAGAISRRLAAGRLLRLHVGVYAVGHAAPRREARWLAAVLACGHGALLSHRSAATLWGIREGETFEPDVSVGTTAGVARAGIRIHRVQLETHERAEFRRIPVTSPARTIADLAHEVEDDEFMRAVREAQYRNLFDPIALRRQLDRRPSRLLASVLDDLTPTRSHLEDRVLPLLAGLPAPVAQHPVSGKRVDFAWPAQKLIVETDGWQAHGTRAAFQADRAQTNRLQLDGYTVLRFTHADVTRRPKRVAEQIRAALIRSGS